MKMTPPRKSKSYIAITPLPPFADIYQRSSIIKMKTREVMGQSHGAKIVTADNLVLIFVLVANLVHSNCHMFVNKVMQLNN